MGGGWGGMSSHGDTKLFSDRGDALSTSETWLHRQPDLEEKDQQINQKVNDEAVCRTALATPGLLNTLNLVANAP